jgi:hypothetical protein
MNRSTEVGHGEKIQAVSVGLDAEPDASGGVGGIRAVSLAKRGTEQDIVIGHLQSFRRRSLDTSPCTGHHAAGRSTRLALPSVVCRHGRRGTGSPDPLRKDGADEVIGYIMTHACYETGLPVASSTANRLA